MSTYILLQCNIQKHQNMKKTMMTNSNLLDDDHKTKRKSSISTEKINNQDEFYF